MNITISKNKLLKNGEEISEFKNIIKDYLVIESNIIVLTESPIKSRFNENIFCVNNTGKILWQIQKISHVYEDSPYDRIVKIDSSVFEAWNYDSNTYIVDVRDGKILSSRFLK